MSVAVAITWFICLKNSTMTGRGTPSCSLSNLLIDTTEEDIYFARLFSCVVGSLPYEASITIPFSIWIRRTEPYCQVDSRRTCDYISVSQTYIRLEFSEPYSRSKRSLKSSWKYGMLLIIVSLRLFMWLTIREKSLACFDVLTGAVRCWCSVKMLGRTGRFNSFHAFAVAHRMPYEMPG